MREKYFVDICGEHTALPVISLPNGAKICFFNLHGNVKLTERCAAALAERVADCDVLLTAESKGLQLTHCVARELGHDFYAVARKSKKTLHPGRHRGGNRVVHHHRKSPETVPVGR